MALNGRHWDVFIGTLPMLVAVVLVITLATTTLAGRLDDMAARMVSIEIALGDLRERVSALEAHPAVSAPDYGRRR